MGLLSILLLGVGLSLDTFAVSLTLGCFSERITSRQRIRFLVTIGMFHFLMILAGWTFGESISGLIADYDHWIAFVLLGFVGGKMIQEGCSPAKDSAPTSDLLSLRNTLLQFRQQFFLTRSEHSLSPSNFLFSLIPYSQVWIFTN